MSGQLKHSFQIPCGSEHLNKMADAVVECDAYVDVRFHYKLLTLALVLASLMKTRLQAYYIRYSRKSYDTVHFGLWKYDTVPRANNFYCFSVKNPPERIAL